MRVLVAGAVAERLRTLVVRVAQVGGHLADRAVLRRRPRAFQIASAARLLFGAVARWIAAWLRLSCASGSPTCSSAWPAATATSSAVGSAMPMSSLAKMIIRRAMKRASSPASSMRAR